MIVKESYNGVVLVLTVNALPTIKVEKKKGNVASVSFPLYTCVDLLCIIVCGHSPGCH